MKKKIYIPIFILFTITLILLLFGRAIPTQIKKLNSTEYSTNSLTISNDIYFRQTLNNCAPYSVMAVINILLNEKIDPEILATETPWRIYKNLTYPQGVIDQLKRNNIKVKEFTLSKLDYDTKKIWIKNQIDLGHPIILLIEIHHVKHYITIIGYNENGYMVYDSMQDKLKSNPRYTINENVSLQGNRFYTSAELNKLWNDGGYKIFFRNWAVVCSI